MSIERINTRRVVFIMTTPSVFSSLLTHHNEKQAPGTHFIRAPVLSKQTSERLDDVNIGL